MESSHESFLSIPQCLLTDASIRVLNGPLILCINIIMIFMCNLQRVSMIWYSSRQKSHSCSSQIFRYFMVIGAHLGFHTKQSQNRLCQFTVIHTYIQALRANLLLVQGKSELKRKTIGTVTSH